MEWFIVLDEPESKSFEEQGEAHHKRLLEVLEDCGMSETDTAALRCEFPSPPRERFAFMLTGTAIALQRHAGHEVGYVHWEVPDSHPWLRAVYEFEDDDTNENAGRLSLALLAHVMTDPQLVNEDPDSGFQPRARVEEFFRDASDAVMPADTRAIIRAAELAGVPCLRLDRWPFPPTEKVKRVRSNSALLLGQGKYRHLVDGTLCVSRSPRALSLSGEKLRSLHFLSDLGASLGTGAVNTEGSPQPGAAQDSQAQQTGSKKGTVLVANGEVIGFISDEAETEVGDLHPEIVELACRAASELNVGLLALTIVSMDFGKPLEETGGTVEDLQVAPKLDRLLPSGSKLLDQAAEAFISWLYPADSQARIPIVAVTGTNGKTTTTRMVARILEEAGFATGMACTDGVYVESKFQRSAADKEIIPRMHHLVMTNPGIDAAVIETSLGRIRTCGFPYDHCNVGVLTNITTERLGPGRETVEQVADLRAAIIERARDGVVLSADDAHTDNMLSRVDASRLAFTGLDSKTLGSRRKQYPEALTVGLASIAGQESVVIHDGGRRSTVMAVGDIPATLDGTARFNVENALQSVAAARLMGVDIAAIRAALESFGPEFDNTLGRLNFFPGLPYQLLLDHAHNADGMRKLCEFTDTLEVAGRRILMFAAHDECTDPEIEAMGLAAAGHFDHFVCRSYLELRGREPGEIASLLREQLLRNGVSADRVKACEDPVAAVDVALGMAKPGDLLVMTRIQNEATSMWSRFVAELEALEQG